MTPTDTLLLVGVLVALALAVWSLAKGYTGSSSVSQKETLIVTATANQSLPNNQTTAILGSVTRPASHSAYNPTTGTITILKDGVYLITGAVNLYPILVPANSNFSSFAQMFARQNGGSNLGTTQMLGDPVQGRQYLAMSTVVYAKAQDTIQIIAYQISGSAATIASAGIGVPSRLTVSQL